MFKETYLQFQLLLYHSEGPQLSWGKVVSHSFCFVCRNIQVSTPPACKTHCGSSFLPTLAC